MNIFKGKKITNQTLLKKYHATLSQISNPLNQLNLKEHFIRNESINNLLQISSKGNPEENKEKNNCFPQLNPINEFNTEKMKKRRLYIDNKGNDDQVLMNSQKSLIHGQPNEEDKSIADNKNHQKTFNIFPNKHKIILTRDQSTFNQSALNYNEELIKGALSDRIIRNDNDIAIKNDNHKIITSANRLEKEDIDVEKEERIIKAINNKARNKYNFNVSIVENQFSIINEKPINSKDHTNPNGNDNPKPKPNDNENKLNNNDSTLKCSSDNIKKLDKKRSLSNGPINSFQSNDSQKILKDKTKSRQINHKGNDLRISTKFKTTSLSNIFFKDRETQTNLHPIKRDNVIHFERKVKFLSGYRNQSQIKSRNNSIRHEEKFNLWNYFDYDTYLNFIHETRKINVISLDKTKIKRKTYIHD